MGNISSAASLQGHASRCDSIFNWEMIHVFFVLVSNNPSCPLLIQSNMSEETLYFSVVPGIKVESGICMYLLPLGINLDKYILYV